MATLFKRRRKGGSGVWYVTYFVDGRCRMKSTGTTNRNLAMEVLRKLETDLLRQKLGLEVIEEVARIMLSEFIGIYLQDRLKIGKAPRTVKTDA